jgi:iron complex transport system substrate-binding protein
VIADGLLLELSDPERILALSGYGAEHLPYGYRYAGRKLVQSERDTEGILALHPDLVLFHSFGSPARVALLREAGVAAFSLGEMRGVVTFLANARTVATLLGHPERGERFATNFLRRFNQVAADLDPAKRRRALYLGSYGNRIYGGAAGSSYHDVLEHAGLIDAAKGYEGWPQYSPEQVLSLDPEVIVTKPGMTSVICRTAGLERLAACARNGFVEIDSDVLDDPGLLMLDAAEAVYDRVYGGDHGQ